MNTRLMILFALIVCRSYAQSLDSLKSKKIQLHAGFSQNTVRDEIFSPLLYSGFGPEFDINYQSETPKHLSRIALVGNSARLRTKYENIVKQTNGALSYSYFRRLKKTNWSVGGMLKTQVCVQGLYFSKALNPSAMNGNLSLTLNIAARYQTATYKWGKVIVEADIPVVGVTFLRKMYNNAAIADLVWKNDDENFANLILKTAEIISFSKLRAMGFTVLYQYPTNHRTTFLMACTFNGYQYERLHNSSHAMNLSFKLGFGFVLKSKPLTPIQK